MKRRHLYGASVVPEAPPEWVAMRDGYGGWAIVLWPLLRRGLS